MAERRAENDYPSDLNIAVRLAEAPLQAGWGQRTAFRFGDQRTTYEEVADAASRWAGALGRLGVAAEERVLIALPDAASFPTAFLGTIRHGAVAVPVNPYLPADRYRFFLADSRASVAVVPPWLLAPVLAAAPRLPRLRHVAVFHRPGTPDGGEAGEGVVETPGPAGKAPAVHDADELLAASAAGDPAPTSCDEPAFWLYTSGSTGAPKGAIHLHHDIWVCAESWARQTMEMGPDHVHLSASKLYFAYGLGNSLHCPMWTGGSAILAPQKPTPSLMLDLVASHQATHFYAVPSFYNAILADEGFAARVDAGELETLQVCVSAGEALPAPLCTAWMERTGVPLLDGIGSTELLHIFIANRPDDVRPGCSGRPIPGYEARVVGDDGDDTADDEVGDLWIRGDSACAGYWNRHGATKRALMGEWFITGDKYRRDADGYYWYAGRADDMFKVHGQWVSPPLVEAALLSHDAVREAAVVAGTDAEGLARGVAFVVPAGERGDDVADRILEHVARELPRYAVPGSIEFCDELPKTATGKIQRYLLREEE